VKNIKTIIRRGSFGRLVGVRVGVATL